MTSYVAQQLGNYRVMRHLGRGGFADVYLGVHVHLKTQAAIKVLHTELTSSDVEKFRAEARTIARLEHPHIVRVLDFGIDGSTPFLVMTYAPNGTLRQRYPGGTNLPLDIVVSYVRQLAEALQYAHQHRLIHRDIKPENMLLGRHNEVLLSDFGFALIAQSSLSQQREALAGTIAYMAPEQLQGQPSSASDQYSLGVVVYEWLTGTRPFQGTSLEIATQHMLEPPPSLRARNPAIPAEIEEVVLTALAKDPLQRFARVQAFATALEQASQLDGLPSSSSAIAWELSGLTSAGTQPLSLLIPDAPTRDTTQVPQVQGFDEDPGDVNSTGPRPSSNGAAAPAAGGQRRLSRRAVVFGLAGLAVGSAVSNGIWLAKSAGLFAGTLPTATPGLLPLPGTTLLTYTGHSGSVSSVAWSPDGDRLASGSSDKTVQVWDGATGRHVVTYHGHKDWVMCVTWSPDGKYLASGGDDYTGGGDRTAQVWEAATGKPVYTFLGHTDAVSALAWSSDGKRLASGSYDRSVRVWDAFSGQHEVICRGHSNWVRAVAWSPNGAHLASASNDGTVRVWDAHTGHEVMPALEHGNWVQSVAWSPDGKYLASATGDSGSNGNREHLVHVWNATSGKPVYTYRGHTDEVTSVAWSPDGRRIASASGDAEHAVQVWEALSGTTVLSYREHYKKIWCVAWSPEGGRLASASRDRLVLVWKA